MDQHRWRLQPLRCANCAPALLLPRHRAIIRWQAPSQDSFVYRGAPTEQASPLLTVCSGFKAQL
ncbi:hypothetical protein SBV1_1020013 [Verrucomicrobia bacterium]|nr:hypothetical protein SBV1_1020013 [Verrucomicrobiota bacterium]